MGRIKTIARRTFLIGSVAIAGGVAFGVYRVKTPYANPLKDGLADGTASFNPWVMVDSEKVTLITPHADKGQGAVSVQAALIAEELDIEFGQFEVSFGPPDKAYYNTAMADEGVPFMSTDEGLAAETMRSVMGGAMKLIGMQGTGGSTTVPDSFSKLREAGAVARETLKLAASIRSGVPVSVLKTAGGAVQLPDGSQIRYTELAADAADLDPVTDIALRDPDQWRLIGKPMQRLDMVAKSTGTMAYGIDFTTPAGRLMLTMIGGVSEFFSDQLGVHVSKSKKVRAESGFPVGNVPFGYRVDTESGVATQVPEEAVAVAGAFERKAAGDTNCTDHRDW